MGSEAAAVFPSESDAEGPRAVGSDELAQGLLLVRASAINVIRLQLAMERRDRRTALETVDDLMVLDRRISNFLSDLPISADGVSAAQQELEEQGRALAREKFALAAGISGPLLEAAPAAPAAPPSEPALDLIDEERVPRALSSKALVALLMLGALVLAAAAFLFLTEAGQHLIAQLYLVQGAL